MSWVGLGWVGLVAMVWYAMVRYTGVYFWGGEQRISYGPETLFIQICWGLNPSIIVFYIFSNKITGKYVL